MKVILKLEDFIFKSKNSHFVMVLFLLLIFKVGIWFMPNLGSSRAVSQNPFSNPFHGTDMYIFWNWLGPFLTWALGIQSWLLFFLFHLICSFLFILVFIRLAFKSFPNTLARKTLIIFLSRHLLLLGRNGFSNSFTDDFALSLSKESHVCSADGYTFGNAAL